MNANNSASFRMPWKAAWRGGIRLLDRLLRRAGGLVEWSDDPNCLLRFRVIRMKHAVALPDRVLPAGAPVLELHVWNEHVPPIPDNGPSVGWAVQLQRMVIASFRDLARQLQRDPQLADVQALTGTTVLIPFGHNAGAAHIARRLGFTVLPHHERLGRFGEFWEKLYAWWIMGAFNPQSLKRRRFFRMRRVEVWMSVETFLQRYGPRGSAPCVDEMGPPS